MAIIIKQKVREIVNYINEIGFIGVLIPPQHLSFVAEDRDA